MALASDLLRAGFRPWFFFLTTIALWIAATWLLTSAPTDTALGLGLFGWLPLLLILLFLSERFWRRFFVRSFVNEAMWLWSWVLVACIPLILSLAFRAALYDSETASPGEPVIALLEPLRLLLHFFTGPWSFWSVAFRILCLVAFFVGVFAWHLNTVSRTNPYMAHLRTLLWKSKGDAMRRDVEKRRFGPHRNLFDDN